MEKKVARIDEIETLLYEAYKIGIQNEVRDTARAIINKDRFIDPLVAYEIAFQQTITKNETRNSKDVCRSNT